MSFPPVKTLATVPVPQSTALKYLSAFLAATSTTPYLLPGARLEPTGPTAGSSASPMIYNLQRVEAGLKGEWLAPVLELQAETEGKAEGKGDVGAGEWQDLDEYQKEQSVEVGDVGEEGSKAVQEGDEGFEVPAEMEEEAPKAKRVKTKHERGKEKVSKPLSKDEKKKAKKERLKEMKKDKRAAALTEDATED